ncbi:hypothetical protein BsWGS_01221 [Bradybaena similaris]
MDFICRTCNSSDFIEVDGLFFCTECRTQTEDVQQEEQVTSTQVDFSAGFNEVRCSQIESQSSRKKPKPSLGRPWTIYEAYQVIILAQADGLIAQGARQDLKDVVFTIWANYLAKLGVAFCKNEQLVPDIVAETKYGRLRELCRGTLDNPLNRMKRPFIEDKSKTAPKAAVDNNENTYEGDQADSDKEDRIMFMNDDPDKDVKLRYTLGQLRALHSPEWMNMSKTLAMCYIGLMFTNPNIVPCDVVRFVYESKVPYLSVTHLLPADMVLSTCDGTLFESVRLDTNLLTTETNKLLAYLQLDKMQRPDLTVLVRRFVQELCLPGEFTTYCFNLMAMVPFLWKHSSKTSYIKEEVVAMSYIILALKIALGLDDTTELKLSKYSHKLQGLLKPEIKLFVWSDWRKFMMRKSQDEFCAFRDLTCDIHKSKLQHLDELVECYTKTGSDKRRYSVRRITNIKQNLKRSLRPEFRKLVREPLEIALERLQRHRDLKQDAVRRNKEDLARRNQEFQHSTMNHIVDIPALQEQFKDILSENKPTFEKLLKRYSLPRTEILEYNITNKEENLISERHGSYLWLLHLVSSIVDRPIMELDKITVHLQKYFIKKMGGEVKPGLVCCQTGSFYVAEERMLKEWPFAFMS